MKTFTMFRHAVPDTTHDANQKNAPDEPQFEGIVFSDGYVAVRWLTAKRSVSVWGCMDDLLAIHGHPEYGSTLVWTDSPEVLREAVARIAELEAALASYDAGKSDREILAQERIAELESKTEQLKARIVELAHLLSRARPAP